MPNRFRANGFSAALVFLAVSVAAAALGGLVTAPAIDGWYRELAKPAFNPPDWVFGPAWTVLYTLIAYAAWRAWRAGEGAARRGAFIAYGVQMILNAAWSLLFFGLRSPILALVDIVLLLVAIAVNARLFHRIDRLAGVLLLPYLAWVAFATLLNASIVLLN